MLSKILLNHYVYFIHGQHLKGTAVDEKLKVFVSGLILHCITLISLSLELLTEWPDQGSACREKNLRLPTCAAQRSSRQAHKGSDTWSRKKAGAFLLEPLTSLRVLPEWLGLQPNLGCVGGSEMDDQKDQPATELLHLYSALTWS